MVIFWNGHCSKITRKRKNGSESSSAWFVLEEHAEILYPKFSLFDYCKTDVTKVATFIIEAKKFY